MAAMPILSKLSIGIHVGDLGKTNITSRGLMALCRLELTELVVGEDCQ